MKIIADKDIPLVERYFSSVGTVTCVDGRAIDRRLVRDADLLVVRTVTRVSEQLLHGSSVSMVASATSGIDHIDLDYLHGAGISLFQAAGANARPVAEYVLSSLCVLAGLDGYELQGKRVGIIGCGNVGSTLLRLLEIMGAECLVNDPPLRDSTGDTQRYRDLAELQSADIISLHVPLQDNGPYPTRGLVDEAFLAKLRSDVVLINTSRGAVVHGPALARFLDACPGARAVLDVWEGEPDVDTELLRRVIIGTAHIAGYSLEGKIRATRMVYGQVCTHLEVEASASDDPEFEDLHGRMEFASVEDMNETLRFAVLAGYDVRGDSAALRRVLEMDAAQRGPYFDDLRRSAGLRREFSAMTIGLPARQQQLRARLAELGFTVEIRDNGT